MKTEQARKGILRSVRPLNPSLILQESAKQNPLSHRTKNQSESQTRYLLGYFAQFTASGTAFFFSGLQRVEDFVVGWQKCCPDEFFQARYIDGMDGTGRRQPDELFDIGAIYESQIDRSRNVGRR